MQAIARGPLEDAIAVALQPLDELRVAYLFGSQARGTPRPDSDLDVALLLQPGLDPGRRASLLLNVIVALTDALGPLGERADVLDLGEAGSSVAFRVIRDGKCVLCRDPRERVRLEASIARRYDDERPYRELFRRAAQQVSERMGKGSHGRS
ncbi:MAG: nucleotidyltransferase domain-containing protein [Polyangiales bacterium]